MAAEKAAIVTGASSGIGLAIAKVLGEEGYSLTVASRRPEKLEGAVAELREAGHEVESLAANVADEEQIKQVVAKHRERFGRLDVLVNNAGVGSARRSARSRPSTSTCSWRSTCARSSSSTASACRCCARRRPSTRTRWWSTRPRSPASTERAWLSVYSATKHGVVGWTEAMNKELGPDGIKSTALCPAFVDTPMTDFVKEHVPAEEMIRPEDIAESVRFLLRVSPACVVPRSCSCAPARASSLAG